MRYAFLSTSTLFFSCATSFTSFVNACFFSSEVKYGVKWWMQSRVDAFGVFLSHSITIASSSSPVTVACALRFFGFPGAAPSSAFRLLFGFPFAGGDVTPLAEEVAAGGLSARPAGGGLPAPATGLVARLPVASGLLARLEPFAFSFGIFALGLVARIATTECPP